VERFKLLLTLTTSLVLLCGTPLVAQEPTPQPLVISEFSQPSQPSPTQPARHGVFKSEVELVALNVTVTDTTRKYVTGLGKTDFAIFEDGVRQELTFFAADAAPIDLAILLDTSSSMQDKMQDVHEAAIGFARTLRANDRGAVVGFDTGVRVLQGFTHSISDVEGAIRVARAQGGTALHNALYITLKEFTKLGRANQEVRRQAIVVLSDGEDTASLLSFDDVLPLAKQSGVSIYTITMKSRYAGMGRSPRRYFSQSEYSMKSLAQETGAQAFFPLEVRELSRVYDTIATELAHQYALAYSPRNGRRDGVFRRVIVTIPTRPDVRPRTRMGYLAHRDTRATRNITP
jgi:Ca-activated chloride channel family protein